VSELSYKTISANKETVNKEWIIIDATNEVLGRLASKVAKILRGKHKTNFTPHVDCGDNVIVINAEKVRLTGKKWDEKNYIRYSGYPGGQKTINARELWLKHPTRLIEKSVRGMLPKNRLSNAILNNLHIYQGAEHKHEAQKPKQLKLEEIK
jgi:large subunit ribosomal protein L13